MHSLNLYMWLIKYNKEIFQNFSHSSTPNLILCLALKTPIVPRSQIFSSCSIQNAKYQNTYFIKTSSFKILHLVYSFPKGPFYLGTGLTSVLTLKFSSMTMMLSRMMYGAHHDKDDEGDGRGLPNCKASKSYETLVVLGKPYIM